MLATHSNPQKPARILVVDDEQTVCQSVQKILARKGHQVDHELSVGAALRTMESGKKFDVVIADLMMPQVPGTELIKVVKDRWPEVPVLVITGYASIASAVETTRLGAQAYLPKPFTPEELEQAVEKAVQTPVASDGAGETPEGTIDVDMPFDAREVAAATSPAYVDHLTRSDVPIVDPAPSAGTAVEFCSLGQRSCKRLVTKGICKLPECPVVAAEKKRATKEARTSFVGDPIDVDMPFSAREVAAATSESYANALGRSDLPNLGFWKSEPVIEAKRILVVDDEAVVVNSIRKALARRGHSVEAAYSTREALQRILAGRYDLVLLDMRMPDGNGLDLLPRIRKSRPELPVVIVTGYASIDTAVEAVHRGARDYMAKPFTPDELYGMTDRILAAA